MLTLGSLFDGSGGFPLAASLNGIDPIWASEIEPFPVAVTRARFPEMKHLGDVSTVNGKAIAPVDIITFGSPCQDLSIAGTQKGLAGERSGLFAEAIRIIKEMRQSTDGEYPKIAVWENVPGAFSSNSGEDFRTVVESFVRIKDEAADVPRPPKGKWGGSGLVVGDGYSVGWRTLDAQYWGVPQRRKRIFLVASFTDERAAGVLFESESLQGHPSESRGEREGTPDNSSDCVGTSGFGVMVLNDQGGDSIEVSEGATATLRAQTHGHPPRVVDEEKAIVFDHHPNDSRVKESPTGTVQTLSTRMGTGGNNIPLVLRMRSGCKGGGKGPLVQKDQTMTLGCGNDQSVFVPHPFGICSKDSNSMRSDNPHSGFYKADTARTLDRNGGNPNCNQGGIAVVALEGNGARPSHLGSGFSEEGVSFTLNATEQHGVAVVDMGGGKPSVSVQNDCSPTLSTTHYGAPAVATPIFGLSKDTHFTRATVDVSPTLLASDWKDPVRISTPAEYIVRRLTPTECARLQGFPDWWCDGIEVPNPTTEELAFWTEVWNTWTDIGKTKRKSERQIREWLSHPRSDAAEYKMWGNGVALPCVDFVMGKIRRCLC